MENLASKSLTYQTRTTTWNLPGPSGTRDCILAYVITFMPCMVKFSHLMNIAIEL